MLLLTANYDGSKLRTEKYYGESGKRYRMEPLTVNNQKRKKRKTRKNLDAIRKKARQITFGTDINKTFNPVIKSNDKFLVPKSSICITSKRLTLFRRAVSSDTVSRTVICEINNRNHNKENKNINILEIQAQTQKENILSTKLDNNQCVNCISNHNQSNEEIDMDKTPHSIILFSPPLHNSTGDSDTSEKIRVNGADNVLIDIYSENNLHSENKLYNEFMNEIPNYLQQTASILLKTDIVDKYKDSLRSLYIEAHPHYGNKDKYVSSYHSGKSDTDDDSVIENPKHPEDSNPELASSPLCSLSSNSTIRRYSSPFSLNTSDSPEYVYYPHKLNQ